MRVFERKMQNSRVDLMLLYQMIKTSKKTSLDDTDFDLVVTENLE